MVTTRNKSVDLLMAKSHRLLETLVALGMVRRGVGPQVFQEWFFHKSTLLTSTQQSRWSCLNTICYRHYVGSSQQTFFIACVHSLELWCPACEVAPDADMMDNGVFCRM